MSNKAICVTGATGRNSAAVVARLLENDHQVVAGDNAEMGQPEGVRMEGLHPIAFCIPYASACEAAIDEALEVVGAGDALVNASSMRLDAPLWYQE